MLLDGPHRDIVITSRVRLARNLDGPAFPGFAKKEDRTTVMQELQPVVEGLPEMKDGFSEDLGALDAIRKQVLVEKHLISREQAAKSGGSAAVINRDQSLSIMINEEDHLRMQSIRSGLDLRVAYAALDRVDEELDGLVKFAFHPRFGYLTACPTNLGTGMRASAMLHLPGEAAETVALVSALEDRFPGMWRRAESGAFERDLELLRGMVPPVFEKHEGGVTVLKPFGLPLVSRGLSAVVGPGQPLLPVLGGGESGGVVAAVEVGEEADGGEEVEAPRAQPSLALESGLDGRAVVTGPGWPERMIDETWPETAEIPFMLGVDAGGRVRHCLPVTPATGVDHEKLRGPLLGMRFAARPGTGVQWVTAAVRW
jgi:hypothetical protein